MMIKFRYTPIELGEGIPKDLYNKQDANSKWALFWKNTTFIYHVVLLSPHSLYIY